MDNLNVNISIEDVISQRNEKNEKNTKVVTGVAFDEKNYLNTRLKQDEKEKTLVVRLLPFSVDENVPFHEVFFHNIKLKKKGNNSSGWKKFPCPKENKLGEKCPFCEISNEFKNKRASTMLETEKKQYGDIAYSYAAKSMWVVRCIERGHEEDGVKFWLFNNSKKGDGVYDKIVNIAHQRYMKAKQLGKVNNIFDLYEGKDLILTITRDTNNKTVINVTDDDEKTPLTNDENKLKMWITDSKKWTDVYKVKSYEYMSIVAEGDTPIYDSEKKIYVAESELLKNKQEEEANRLREASENLSRVGVDYSNDNVFTPFAEQTASSAEPSVQIFSPSTQFNNKQDEDELPF